MDPVVVGLSKMTRRISPALEVALTMVEHFRLDLISQVKLPVRVVECSRWVATKPESALASGRIT